VLLVLAFPLAAAAIVAPSDWRPFGEPPQIHALSVVSLDEREVFTRRVPERGTEYFRPVPMLSAEAGGITAMGNVGTSVLYARFQASYRWGWNRLSLEGLSHFGAAIVDIDGDGSLDDAERDDGFTTTHQKLHSDLRYDRFLGRMHSIYTLGGWRNDPFSGYLRRLHGQSGYSRFLVANDEHEFVGESGFDVAHELYATETLLPPDWVYSARGYVGWTTTVDDKLQLVESIESFVNVEDTDDVRLIGEFSLALKATNVLSVKTTYIVEHETRPVIGYRGTDQMMALTLVATMFGKLPEPLGPPQ
jgi:putative salt-induced outer membrane protein YdiY